MSDSDASRCPLCGGANDCQLCTMSAYKGPCWCMVAKIPEALLARVPTDLRRRACLCRACVTEFHREQNDGDTPALKPGDFYFDVGLLVLTEAYLRQRGYCCGNGCRHCPYPGQK